MSSQIFRTSIDIQKLFDFLDQCTSKKKNIYTFSKVAFKTAQYKELIDPFCKEVEQYYYDSKKYYATRKMTYKNFITILRQLCKQCHFGFTSNIKYYKSAYEISYTIYVPPEQ